MARGGVPEQLAEYLAGASLLALEKPGGGVRPIAIGEVLRRLVAKCFCHFYEREATGYLCQDRLELLPPWAPKLALRQLGSGWKETKQQKASSYSLPTLLMPSTLLTGVGFYVK